MKKVGVGWNRFFHPTPKGGQKRLLFEMFGIGNYAFPKYNRERNKKSNAIRETQNRLNFNLKVNRLKLTMVKPLPLKKITNKVKKVSTLIQKMYKNK